MSAYRVTLATKVRGRPITERAVYVRAEADDEAVALARRTTRSPHTWAKEVLPLAGEDEVPAQAILEVDHHADADGWPLRPGARVFARPADSKNWGQLGGVRGRVRRSYVQAGRNVLELVEFSTGGRRDVEASRCRLQTGETEESERYDQLANGGRVEQ